ncbi:MAG TPA: ATP-binding protein [Candidatus Sulfotelmatobacter sp.]|nr:ATP-binding protein [Candidatus Sulfotelmatobacter sp.]
MRRLALRSRLTLTLAAAAVVPVLAFSLLVVLVLDQSVGDRQADALGAEARLAADELGADVDAATAARLAGVTGAGVTVFDGQGRLLASSGAGADQVPAPAPQPSAATGTASTTTTTNATISRTTSGLVVAYASVGGPRPLFVLALSQPAATGPALLAPLLAILVATLLFAAFLSLALGRSLVRPLAEVRETLDRLQAGDLQAQVPVESDDELGRLAASHNRLAATLAGRNRALAVVSQAFAPLSPQAGAGAFAIAAERAAGQAFGFTAVQVRLGTPPEATPPERVPGEAFEVEAPLAIGDDVLGVIRGTLAPTRDWGEADQDLLRVLGIQLAGAIRNAELFEATAELAELKNEFLRGVSHNLQTPLTSIRAFAGQLADETGDRRLGIIVEQTERLSRLVAQLLTVTKIEAGTLKPDVDVFPMAALVRRAWESLGHASGELTLEDGATNWLATADRDWVEQVVWALLDNALRYGGGTSVDVRIAPATGPDGATRLETTVRDHGPGIAAADRDRVFERFTRLAPGSSEGSGLGLSVARGLVEAMGGQLWLAAVEGPGAAFTFSLPAEHIGEP